MKKEDVDKMSLQEACDFAVSKIVEQGERCVTIYDGNISCSYGNEGLHCLVGWLLDKENSELMNFRGELVDEDFKNLLPELIR